MRSMAHDTITNEPTPREIRRASGLSQERVAVEAGVCSPTVRIYEVDPLGVRDDRKRAALDLVYARMRATLASRQEEAQR